jgi:hypothetical protein
MAPRRSIFVIGVTFGFSRLRPAAPTVDGATIWQHEVKRGPMFGEVRGLGTLVQIEAVLRMRCGTERRTQ